MPNLAVVPPVPRMKTRYVMVFLPKGGAGKTTISQHITVAAAASGFRTLAVDFDPQGTMSRWYRDRSETAKKQPGAFQEVDVAPADINDWQDVFDYGDQYELVVLDMPPSVKGIETAINDITERVDLILIPTGESKAEWEIALEWMQRFHERGMRKKTKFVLNRVKADNRKVTTRISVLLDKHGLRLPVVLPLRDDVFLSADEGLTTIDLKDTNGSQRFEQLWDNVRMEIDL